MIVAAVAAFTLVLQRTAHEVRANFAVSLALPDLIAGLTDAETGQRGYLLTGDETYLAPYTAARANIAKALSDLDSAPVGADLKVDLAELQKSIEEKLAELADTIALYRAGSHDGALAIVKSDRGKLIMDHIRDTLARMRTIQQSALARAFAARDKVATGLQVGVVAAVLGVIALAIFATFDARKRIVALAQQSRLTEERNAALEESNRKLVAETEARHVAEAQVRQIQKMEAIGQLAGGIAHDFNNMLAVIMGSLDMLLRRLKRGDTDITRFVESATEGARRAADLTKRLLAFSRQQPLSPARVDANKLVAEMSELIRRAIGEDVALETILAGGLWKVHVDAGQLENSILNLAVNGRDAMPGGGRITIETANGHLDEQYARENPGAKPGQYVLVAFTDTGEGMPPDTVNRAFDPFFTTKPAGQGTGLGLSQVYGFVKQSGGHIKIYSEVGRGTTVKIYLPRDMSESETQSQPAEARPIAAGKPSETILLVDDEPRVRALAVESLREIGYRVIAAGRAEEALQLLDANPATDLLFTDIVMPDMDGRRLADEATRRRPMLKVLFTTGFTKNAVIHNGVLDPGVNFLAKPFTIEALAAKVRLVLDG
jgi:signal transduction histidine kinase